LRSSPLPNGVYVGDFNGDGKMNLAVFGYINTGVGAATA
jgi:hypothetical protein